MRFLIDTHIAIWAVSDLARLLPADIEAIRDARNDIFVSAISYLEIAIKFSLGRDSCIPFSATTARSLFAEAGFQTLPVQAEHAIVVETLPRKRGDPFDRLIVAQALAEPMHVISYDELLLAHLPRR